MSTGPQLAVGNMKYSAKFNSNLEDASHLELSAKLGNKPLRQRYRRGKSFFDH